MSDPQFFMRLAKSSGIFSNKGQIDYREIAQGIHRMFSPMPIDEVVEKLVVQFIPIVASQLVHSESFQQNPTATAYQTISEMIQVPVAMYAWARDSFPHFSLTSDFFHAVSNTDFGDFTDEPLYMPFDSFSLSFPPTEAFGGASRAYVFKTPRPYAQGTMESPGLGVLWPMYRASLFVPSDKGNPNIWTQWKVGKTRREMIAEIRQSEAFDYTAGTEPLDEQEVKMMGRLRLLLANVMSFVESCGPLPTTPRRRGDEAKPVELVHKQNKNFEVGRTIKLDPRIRDAISRSGVSPETWKVEQRFIVRGHWRSQPCGRGKMDRKRIWIEPHWKGPENAKNALERKYEVG